MVPSLFTDFFGRDFFDDEFFQLAPVSRSMPATNVKETDTSYQLELSVPGFSKEDFKVKVDEDVLSIEALHREEKKDENERYTRREFRTSSFMRSFRLPKRIKAEGISANYENGILKLVVPRVQESGQSGSKEIAIS